MDWRCDVSPEKLNIMCLNAKQNYIGLSLDKVWSELKILKNLFWEGHKPLPYIIVTTLTKSHSIFNFDGTF
ncbi:MAG: hypothetical protein Phog2KO_50030 [Phototrophicaceae bacterium]